MVTEVNLGRISVKYHTAGQGPLQSREVGDLAFSVFITLSFFSVLIWKAESSRDEGWQRNTTERLECP